MAPDEEELVTAYLAHAEAVTLHGGKRELPAAWERMHELVRDAPEQAWNVIVELVRRTRRDEVLAYIAAGPLENLICEHPYAFIDRVEALAAADAHFKWALSGVWGESRMPDDVRARIDAILGDAPRL
jgi:hypothetical protein